MSVFAERQKRPPAAAAGMLPARETRSPVRATPAAGGATHDFSRISVLPRPKVSAPSDHVEEEADRAADAVLAGSRPRIGCCPDDDAPPIRRKCGGCTAKEREEEGLILAKSAVGGPVSSHAGEAAAAVSEGGAPLAPALRSWFEPRFRYDFSQVRVHDGPSAASAASAISARAFTLGRDIAFAGGEYAPSTPGGLKLLAHELAHVVQKPSADGRPMLARQAAPFLTRTFPERGGGGTTDFTETIQNAPTQSGTIISGTVDRSETAPASGSTPQQTISGPRAVNLQFDTSSCAVTVPYGFNFQQGPTAPSPICQEPPNATAVQPLSATAFQSLRDEYMRYVNEGLNGLFTARITGCQHGCANRPIEIRIDARDNAPNPQRLITVVNRSGRGDAATICAGSMSRNFAVHEGGHQVLGVGDEYGETNASLRQRVPRWARDERVRTDLTFMGNEAATGGFSLFHERHFRFVQVFLEAALPGCRVALEAVPRTIPDFRVSLDLGYARLGGRDAITVGGSFQVGVPLSRLRQTELLLGARGRLFLDTSGPYRNVFLAGVQVGLEHRTSPASVAPTFGVFGGGGVYHQGATPGRVGLDAVPERTSPYLEAGGTFGITSGMLAGGLSLSLRAEAAGGSEITRSRDAMRWFRAGLMVGAEF